MSNNQKLSYKEVLLSVPKSSVKTSNIVIQPDSNTDFYAEQFPYLIAQTDIKVDTNINTGTNTVQTFDPNLYTDEKLSYDNFSSQFKNSNGEYHDCSLCYSFLDEQTYVLYKLTASHDFKPLISYCSNCVNTLLDRQFQDYLDNISSTTCVYGMRQLLSQSPPTNLRIETSRNSDRYDIYELYMDGYIQSAELRRTMSKNEFEEWKKTQESVLNFLNSEEGSDMIKRDNMF